MVAASTTRRLLHSWHVVGLDTLASLVIATFDLEVVRLLRDATRTADLSQSKGCPKWASAAGAAEVEPRKHIRPSPIVEAPERIAASNSFERPAAIVEFGRNSTTLPTACDASRPTEEMLRPLRGHSPIEPPWKVLPWMRLPEPRPKIKIVKIVTKPPDRSHTGALIDCFI